jgi:hypothetical protein
MDQNGVTQEQIDQLFQATDQAAPEVQADLKTLHDAAEQATGKSPSDADAILNSDQVNGALLDLHLHAIEC